MMKWAFLSAVLSVLAGCGAGSDPQGTATSSAGGGEGGGGEGGATSSTSKSAGTGDASSDTSASVTVGSGSSGTGGGDQIAEAFAHTATTLYRLDLDTNQVAAVADFTGCDDDVIDIALDKGSVIYGTTTNRVDPDNPEVPTGGLWRIDKNTAACTLVARGDFPNSLSFVPKGVLDPDAETLVGYLRADYVRIDPVSGAVTVVRPNALSNGLESSGDIVSVIDGPTLLTVKGGTQCSSNDCVVEVDPKTGAALGILGSAGYDSVFGVAFWAGKVYGFTRGGDVFEFYEDENGEIQTEPIPAGNGIAFYGAGSTTAAPPTQIPN